MGYSLRTKTMKRITMGQEPTNLNAASKRRVRNQLADILIKSGNPRLVEQGRAIRRMKNRQFMNKIREEIERNPLTLDEKSVALLAERRTQFIEQIEKKRNNGTL